MNFSKSSISPSTDTELFSVAKSGMLTVCKILYCLVICKRKKKLLILISAHFFLHNSPNKVKQTRLST